MALKLPCTHFPLPIFLPCLSPPPWCRTFTCACASAATCPPSLGKPRGQTQTSPLPAQQPFLPTASLPPLLPLPHSSCALCLSPGRAPSWPQAGGELLVPCSALAHWPLQVGLSEPPLSLLSQGLRGRLMGQRRISARKACSSAEHAEVSHGLGTVQCPWCAFPAEPVAAGTACCFHLLSMPRSPERPCHSASDTRRAAQICR